VSINQGVVAIDLTRDWTTPEREDSEGLGLERRGASREAIGTIARGGIDASRTRIELAWNRAIGGRRLGNARERRVLGAVGGWDTGT